jgi:5-(carboxyamino)imidazole ribonucleotide synthase
VSGPEDAEAALATLNGAPAIAEGFVTFTREISVIAARGRDGAVAAYDPGENVHDDGILPPPPSPRDPRGLRTDAVLIASRILNALDYVA